MHGSSPVKSASFLKHLCRFVALKSTQGGPTSTLRTCPSSRRGHAAAPPCVRPPRSLSSPHLPIPLHAGVRVGDASGA